MSVCLFVPKDLANRWTDMVLLYMVEPERFKKKLGEGTTIGIKIGLLISTPPLFKCPKRPLGA